MRELRDLLTGNGAAIPLDVAALQIATIEHPEVSVEPFLLLLDSYATELGDRVSPSTPGVEFLEALNLYMFEELGFEGNAGDYYHPANSCLNEVLTKRTGLPITLSIVYMEICRRLGRAVFGIGLPGHFVVQYVDDDIDVFLDPFNRGQVLSEEDCYRLALTVTGLDLTGNPEVLQPVSNRHIAVRMLNNLRAAYFRLQNPAKAIAVLNLLIEAMPKSPEEYKQRGLCLTQVQDLQAARRDLETYLRLAPDATDRDDIQAQLAQINLWLSHQ